MSRRERSSPCCCLERPRTARSWSSASWSSPCTTRAGATSRARRKCARSVNRARPPRVAACVRAKHTRWHEMTGTDPHAPPPPIRTIVCAALAQTVLCWLAVEGAALLVVLLAHIGVCTALAWWLRRRTHNATRYDLLLLVTTCAFGPFGPTGVLCTVLLERYHARHAIDVEQ